MRFHHQIRVALFSSLVLLTVEPCGAETPAAPAKTEQKFVRLALDSAGKQVGLETAIVRFVPRDSSAKGLTVDLIAAVHVGDKAYYAALNKEFEAYDAVLYELVAPPGTRIPKGAKAGGNAVSALQNAMKDMLELNHQLEDIDYTKTNLVHADMSPDEFAKSMKDRGESFWTLFFRMMGESLARESKDNAEGKSFDAELIMALFDKNRAVVLKRLMAEQFQDLEAAMLSGAEGSTIISERNKVALKEMSRQIAAGKKHVAIFFGGGHMPDFQKRLAAEYGLKVAGERWLTAWDLRDAGAKSAAAK